MSLLQPQPKMGKENKESKESKGDSTDFRLQFGTRYL